MNTTQAGYGPWCKWSKIWLIQQLASHALPLTVETLDFKNWPLSRAADDLPRVVMPVASESASSRQNIPTKSMACAHREAYTGGCPYLQVKILSMNSSLIVYWKSYLKISTVKTLSILSKKHIFTGNFSVCYWLFIIAIMPQVYIPSTLFVLNRQAWADMPLISYSCNH